MSRIDTCVEIPAIRKSSSVPLAMPCAYQGKGVAVAGKSTRCRCAHRLLAMDALKLAQENPTRKVVFFGLVLKPPCRPPPSLCNRRKPAIAEFLLLLPAHYAYPDAAQFVEQPDNGIDAFLAPGHVSMVSALMPIILSPAIFIVRWWSLFRTP